MSSDTSVLRRRRFDAVSYLKLFRFPLVFTAIADSAAGYLIASPVVHPGAMILVALSSAGLYLFGMALNDIVDRERDRAIAPNRMLPSGRLTVKSAKIAASVALGFSLLAILAVPEVAFLQRIVLWALVVLGIVAYNMFLKFPPVMGFVRAFNLLLGVSAGRLITFDTAGQPWQYAILALPALVYVTALTYVSTLEEAGPNRKKLMVGVGFMCFGALLAALAGPAVHILVYFTPFWEAVLRRPSAILFPIVLSGALIRLALRADDEKGVMTLVRDGVAGIILLDSALLASCEDMVSGLLIASLLLPAALSVAVFKRLA